MKKIVILHGRQSKDKTSQKGPQNERHWIPWLKNEAIKLGFDAYNPLIPNDWKVIYNDWKKVIDDLDKKINIDENTILIGTSAGAGFFVRWLGETKRKISKLILIAPAKKAPKDKDNGYDFINGFWDFEVDETIKGRVGEIVIFTSDTEHKELRKDAELYSKIFGCKLIELPGRGHFTVKDNPKNNKIPEVLEYLK